MEGLYSRDQEMGFTLATLENGGDSVYWSGQIGLSF